MPTVTFTRKEKAKLLESIRVSVGADQVVVEAPHAALVLMYGSLGLKHVLTNEGDSNFTLWLDPKSKCGWGRTITSHDRIQFTLQFKHITGTPIPPDMRVTRRLPKAISYDHNQQTLAMIVAKSGPSDGVALKDYPDSGLKIKVEISDPASTKPEVRTGLLLETGKIFVPERLRVENYALLPAAEK